MYEHLHFCRGWWLALSLVADLHQKDLEPDLITYNAVALPCLVNFFGRDLFVVSEGVGLGGGRFFSRNYIHVIMMCRLFVHKFIGICNRKVVDTYFQYLEVSYIVCTALKLHIKLEIKGGNQSKQRGSS